MHKSVRDWEEKSVREREGEREPEMIFAKMRGWIGEIIVFMDLDRIEDLLKLIHVPKYVRLKSIDVDSKFIAEHKLIWPLKYEV